MTYRVIQWGTGNVGKHSLRAIIERDDLELVGLKVYSPEKVGRDAGSFVNKEPTGVIATSNLDEILALDADVVNYNPVGMTHDMDQAVRDIATLLEAGFNVVSSATGMMIYPKASPENHQQMLASACERGGTTFFESGVNPGFAMDILPITLSRMSRTIDRIDMTEVVDMSRANRPSGNAFIGFGLPPGPCGVDEMHAIREKSPFYASQLMIADAIGFELDDIRYEREAGVAEQPVECAMGTIEPGSVAVQHLSFTGSVQGRDVLSMNFIWRMSDDVRPEWPTGDRWIVEFHGDPYMNMELEVSTDFDARRPVSLMVGMGPLNAIPTICEAAPGVKTALDLPLFGGGYLAK